MDARSFDAWATAVARTGTSRRSAIRLLSAGMLAGVVGSLGRHAAAGRCLRPGRRCERGERCCGGAVCRRKRCRCPRGTTTCGKKCCPRGDICVGGQCVTGAGSCPASADGCLVPESAICDADQNCFCFTARGSGAVRCGQVDPATFCEVGCTADADCAGLGAGAFCAEKTGDSCCFGLAPGDGFCMRPCPA